MIARSRSSLGPAWIGMNARLFVYGTLLSRDGHPKGARLRREARLLGEATIQGRLYSLGRYPVLIEAAAGQYAVHGEVYTLNTPATSLLWLDEYEGIVPGKPERSPYERSLRTVQLATGQAMTAWVYLYRRSVRARPEMPDGYWMPPKA
jgi:gamma-glutamylcyclotransferase (GGCT)/AIG2-like uncharacterized protein YtfP